MMNGGSIRYLVQQGMRNTFKNRLMSIASVGVLTACLILTGASFIISANVDTMVGNVEKQNEMVVYLKEEYATAEKSTEYKKNLEKISDIDKIVYVSKEQALLNEMEAWGESGELLEQFKKDNPLPASFVITVKDIKKMEQVSRQVEKIEGSDKVLASGNVTGILIKIRDITGIFGIVLIVILVAVSLLIISNTIKLTVFARRKEISIMKFVGATNTFIKLPFIVEGILIGILSSLLAFLIVWGGYGYLISYMHTRADVTLPLFGTLVSFSELWTKLVLGFLGFGIFTGIVGSLSAIRKYLNV